MLHSQEHDHRAAGDPSAQRRHSRHHLASPLNLWRRAGTGTMIPGIALEISESGISAILPEQLSVGENVDFILELPPGRLRATAVVRNKSMYRYGFEFESPTAAQQQLIRDACAGLPLYTGPEY